MHARLIALVLAAAVSACTALPPVTAYAPRSGETKDHVENYCAELSTRASRRAGQQFATGWALAVTGLLTAGVAASLPDGTLEAGDVPGGATRLGITLVGGAVGILGTYLIGRSQDATALAADTKRALLFGDGERLNEARNRALWNLCIDAYAAYDDEAGRRRGKALEDLEDDGEADESGDDAE